MRPSGNENASAQSCHDFLREVDGQNIMARVRRIIVPANAVGSARAIAVKYGFKGDGISLAEPEFSPKA